MPAPQPIQPERWDNRQQVTSPDGKARAFITSVHAPGAYAVEVDQVNWPTLPIPLQVNRVSQDDFQFVTRARVLEPGNTAETPIKVALVLIRVYFPTGVVEIPASTATIGITDLTLLALNRPGLRVGDRKPRSIGTGGQVINVAAPSAPLGMAGSLTSGGSGGSGQPGNQPFTAGGTGPQVNFDLASAVTDLLISDAAASEADAIDAGLTGDGALTAAPLPMDSDAEWSSGEKVAAGAVGVGALFGVAKLWKVVRKGKGKRKKGSAARRRTSSRRRR